MKTHVRIALDLLKTRAKEQQFISLCLATGQRFVVDNTNPTIAERQLYIAAAKAYRFEVIGYFFNAPLQEAISRNSRRKGKENISVIGIRAAYKKRQPPTLAEGFDALSEVRIAEDGFQVTQMV